MSQGPRQGAGVELRLARIALWRLLPPGFWLPFLVFLVLTLLVWKQDASLDVDQEAWHARGQKRQAAWVLLACLGAPFLIVRSAGLASSWRRLDADWFGALPVARWRWVRGCALGLLGACISLCLSAALVTELCLAGDAPCGRFVRTLEHRGFSLLEEAAPVRWIQEDLLLERVPKDSSLVFRPSVMRGAGPSVELAFHVLPSSANPGQEESSAALIFGPSRVAVKLPAGAAGAAQLVMERKSRGAPAVLPKNHVDLVSSLASEHWISAELALWTLVILLAWGAMAAGLGAWMRPGLAAGLCLAGVSVAWWGPAQLDFLPGAAAPRAWVHMGLGWAPGPMDNRVLLVALLMLCGGLMLLSWGISRGRQLR